jgi:hypothetical protein
MKFNWPYSRVEWVNNNGVIYNFMNRVEKNLQYAVEAVAKALSWVIDTHLKYYNELDCRYGEIPTDPNSKTVQRFISDYIFLMMWLEIGIFVAMFTFAKTLTPHIPA